MERHTVIDAHAALRLERDALAKCVQEQKLVIGLLSVAVVAATEAFKPNLPAIEKAVSAIDIAGRAITAAGLNEL